MRKPIYLTFAVLAVSLGAQRSQTRLSKQQVETALGVSCSMDSGDVYKVSLPRTDLKVTADGCR